MDPKLIELLDNRPSAIRNLFLLELDEWWYDWEKREKELKIKGGE